MARDETNATRLDRDILTADAVDAKSCKAEETEERIRRMETIDRDRAMQMNANDMWEIPGRIIDTFQTRKRHLKENRHTDEIRNEDCT